MTNERNYKDFDVCIRNTYRTKEEILDDLKRSPAAYHRFASMNSQWREQFLDFCTGKKTLPLLYDSSFKRVFHSDIHPERLSDLISCIIGETVIVREILPQEDILIEGGQLVVLDILVELEDGSFANVEIQKMPYLFPGERMSCYASDLTMRQYSRVKGLRGKNFTYKDLHKVYIIVLYEKTTANFHQFPDIFVHAGTTRFDSGLKLELLQEFRLVALDVFRAVPYDKRKKNRLTGWLSFLTTESPEDAIRLVRDFPWLEEIFLETASYRNNPEEVLTMFSDALRQLDHNTMQYMIDEQQKEIDERQKVLEEQQKELDEQQRVLEEQQKVLEEQQKEIDDQQKELDKQQNEIGEQQKEIEAQQKKLERITAEKAQILDEKAQLTAENARLRQLLESKNS